jgi:hypothetical protein
MRVGLGRAERPDQVVEDLRLGVLRREQALDECAQVGGHGSRIGGYGRGLSRAACNAATVNLQGARNSRRRSGTFGTFGGV